MIRRNNLCRHPRPGCRSDDSVGYRRWGTLHGRRQLVRLDPAQDVPEACGEDGQIEISVNDTGPGLTPGKADQIFDAFFTTKPQGIGMGLAISKSIIESHGGQIWADGNSGRGATFHFTLPAAPAETNPPMDAA